jgi:hypothetical protein
MNVFLSQRAGDSSELRCVIQGYHCSKRRKLGTSIIWRIFAVARALLDVANFGEFLFYALG